jgi:hypothetical protein
MGAALASIESALLNPELKQAITLDKSNVNSLSPLVIGMNQFT